ncbi:hypothetical protein BHE74_00006464 [Ensete ventricosum]|nr:hypothetical protein BHE74_00006464 [Ensete ventricosum]
MQRQHRGGWAGLPRHPDVQSVGMRTRRTPRHRFNAIDPWDAGLAGWGSFDKIYSRHVDPTTGVRLVTLSSEVLMDEAAKAMVLNQHYQATLFNRVHDAGRVITSLDNKVDLLRKEVQRLKEGGYLDAVAAVEARALKAKSLA